MKNVFILQVCLSVGILISCSDDNENAANVETKNLKASTIPEAIISVDDARAILNEHDKELISKDALNETRFVDKDYKELKQYLEFIEKQSEEAGVTIEALRIYIGKYPQELPSSHTVEYPGKKTIFYNPVTSFEGSDGNISYAIKINSDGSKEAITVGSIIDNTAKNNENVQSLSGNSVTFPPPPHPNDPDDFH